MKTNKTKWLAPFVAATLLAACASGNNKQATDYESEQRKAALNALEIPPDLRDPNQGNLYALPDETGAGQGGSVLIKVDNARIERAGNQRWLVIDNKKAAEIWPVLRTFWQESGFTIHSEEAKIGVMETDWAENRAKLAHQGLRKLFDKVGLGSVYSTSERDKFLIRMERNKQGGVDVFFSHKGLKEVYDGKNKDRTVWQPRPNDPNLEAVFLARFMQYIGVDEQRAQQQIQQNQAAANQTGQQATRFARLEQNAVWVAGSAERNVNRIALALDRIGLTVREFIHERGTFIVQPAPNESDVLRQAESKNGWFDKWFGKNKKAPADTAPEAPKMLIALEALPDGQRIHLLDETGKPYQGQDKSALLQSLYRELH